MSSVQKERKYLRDQFMKPRIYRQVQGCAPMGVSEINCRRSGRRVRVDFTHTLSCQHR